MLNINLLNIKVLICTMFMMQGCGRLEIWEWFAAEEHVEEVFCSRSIICLGSKIGFSFNCNFERFTIDNYKGRMEP